MNIADLFVTIGIKGDGEAKKALGGVKGTLGEISTGALAAKAAVVAAVYALEQMMSGSAKTGTELSNFQSITGIAAQDLQRFQYAALKAGGTSEGLTQSLKSVQNAFTGMRLGEGAVKAIEAISRYTGNISKADLKNPLAMMQKIQEFVQKAPPDISRHLLSGLISEDTIAAMHRGAFNPGNLNGQVNSENQNKRLLQVNEAMAKVHWQFDRMSDKLVSSFGPEVMQGVMKIIPEVEKLATAFGKLAEKIHAIELIGEIFKGWGMIFDGINQAMGSFMEMIGKTDDVDQKTGKLKDSPTKLVSDWVGSKIDDYFYLKDGVAPKVKSTVGEKPGPNITHTVNQTITHNGDASDTKAVGDLHKTAIRHAHRTSPAQKKVN